MIILPCTCEEQQHKLQYDEQTENYISEMIKEHGMYKKIIYEPTGVAYKVPAAYILVHGLKGKDLPLLGFPIWNDTPN